MTVTQPLTEGTTLYKEYKEHSIRPIAPPPAAAVSKIDIDIDVDASMRLKLMSKRGNTGQFYLATEDGQMLPCQHGVSIDASFNEATIITVQFVVDNNKVWIDD